MSQGKEGERGVKRAYQEDKGQPQKA